MGHSATVASHKDVVQGNLLEVRNFNRQDDNVGSFMQAQGHVMIDNNYSRAERAVSTPPTSMLQELSSTGLIFAGAGSLVYANYENVEGTKAFSINPNSPLQLDRSANSNNVDMSKEQN